MIQKYLTIFLLIFTSLLFSIPANSAIVVRMEVQQGVNVDEVFIKLFDDLTPLTVTNFLNYINDDDYTNSFFHRTAISTTLSSLQGGGFTFDPLLNDGSFSYDIANNLYLGGLQQVPADPPVINEFSKSNTAGTIAMAKLGNAPNSATSQWFINLADNSSNLDNQNGGFTVFAEIIGDGMNVINTVGAVSVFDRKNIHPAFSELPLLNDVTIATRADLIMVNDISEQFSVTTSFDSSVVILSESKEPEDVDFGLVLLGESIVAIVSVENKSTSPLSLGDIANTNTLSSPYLMVSNDCDFVLLAAGESCEMMIRFTPSIKGIYNDSFNIEFLNLSYTLNIYGAASIVTDALVLSPTNFDFGEILFFDVSRVNVPGEIPLTISNQSNSGINVQLFSVTGEFGFTEECIENNPIPSGAECNARLFFGPQSVGEKSGVLTIVTDTGIKTITLIGAGSSDNDKILTSIENLAPNNGDGNNDGVLDSAQNNVLSIDTANEGYLTIAVAKDDVFLDFLILDDSQLVSPPGDGRLGSTYQFELATSASSSAQVGVTEVGVILPADVNIETYYIYGATEDNNNPHWYEFIFDGITGAQIFNNATITSPEGEKIERTIVKLIFVDSLRGDNDLTINGRINVQGTYQKIDDTPSSSSVNLYALLTMLFVVSIRYRLYRR